MLRSALFVSLFSYGVTATLSNLFGFSDSRSSLSPDGLGTVLKRYSNGPILPDIPKGAKHFGVNNLRPPDEDSTNYFLQSSSNSNKDSKGTDSELENEFLWKIIPPPPKKHIDSLSRKPNKNYPKKYTSSVKDISLYHLNQEEKFVSPYSQLNEDGDHLKKLNLDDLISVPLNDPERDLYENYEFKLNEDDDYYIQRYNKDYKKEKGKIVKPPKIVFNDEYFGVNAQIPVPSSLYEPYKTPTKKSKMKLSSPPTRTQKYLNYYDNDDDDEESVKAKQIKYVADDVEEDPNVDIDDVDEDTDSYEESDNKENSHAIPESKEFKSQTNEVKKHSESSENNSSLNLPNFVRRAGNENDRIEYQIHGFEGPKSYKFGYDTGKGKNRQFRFEERDNAGEVKGEYGYTDKKGRLVIVKYSSTADRGFQVENFFE